MDSLTFADFTLHLRTRKLLRAGDTIKLGARAFDLLELLVTRRDDVVSRDDIMRKVWPDTVVGDNNLNVQVANLRRLLGSDAIVTVSGRGLHFALDVEAGDLPAVELPDKPSIVVLPFSTLGDDPDLSWLADGFVEDITTELSRFRDLFVVARNSAFAYGQAPRDLRLISRELGVRYALEGSVRASVSRVRVTAQLIDATTGGHMWAETFDRDMQDHLETQANVARAVVSCIAPQIDRAEAVRVRARATEDLPAQGLAQRAWTIISAGEMTYDRAPRDQAEQLAREALTRDPDLGLAWRVLAWVAWWNVYHATTVSVPDALAEGIDAATHALEADPTDHHARRLRGQLHLMNNDVRSGLPDLREAHEINPNCALTLCWLGLYEALNGDPEKGVRLAQAGLRRSPRDPVRGSMLCTVGFAQFAARDYEAAAQAAEAALAEATQGATPLILGAIAYVGLGQTARAAEMFRRVERMAPKLVKARLSGKWLSSNPDYLRRAHMFFRIAGGFAPPEAAEPSSEKTTGL
ncbi:winged helix-turn-helix domain-containing protein [Aestuariivita boseongensis]|uniref:winged helix-turn-helix domain-containing protein n=1 Tax=Aestuariivita boseongensis TaxID=1470562 RepID=UPI000682791F|nr:winged helix-turn-helix domain-containing protein [Aestuariivita boseongensis]